MVAHHTALKIMYHLFAIQQLYKTTVSHHSVFHHSLPLPPTFAVWKHFRKRLHTVPVTWLSLEASASFPGHGGRLPPSAFRIGVMGRRLCQKSVKCNICKCGTYIYICEATFIYVTSHLYLWHNIYISDIAFIYVTPHLDMWSHIYMCEPTFINVTQHLDMRHHI